jgi:hypothetical protein
MNVRNIAVTATALIVGMAGTFVAVRAQGPLYDKVIVDLPYTVSVRGTTLQPGHYEIRQLASADNSRVLQIFSNDGMKLETSVMTIPALDNNTPEKTTVILHHFGNDYYFDKVWIQGKNYGYEFPVPDEVKARERERMAPVNVAATYESSPAEATTTTATTKESTSVESATTAKSTSPEAATNNEQTTTAAQEPSTATQSQTTAAQSETTLERDRNAEIARNRDRVNSAADTTTTDSGSANRSMPGTAANWLTMLLSGGLLSGAGLTLRSWKR